MFCIVVDVDAEKEKGVPNFWIQVFGNHPVVAEIIAEQDIPALSFLQDIRCDYNDSYTTFTLSFEFKENPFFTNTVCPIIIFIIIMYFMFIYTLFYIDSN